MHPQVSLGKNSVVTVVEGSPTAEWWRVETDQGVQVRIHSSLGLAILTSHFHLNILICQLELRSHVTLILKHLLFSGFLPS